MKTIMEVYTFGLPTRNIVLTDIQQQYDDTCAIKSQQLILNAAGLNVTEDQLIAEAYHNGWYTPGKGTSVENVGKLLDFNGMPNSQIEHGSLYNLAEELSQNHPVLVGVDSGELWDFGINETFEDLFLGPQADHALIVSGIQFNEDFTDGVVNVIDPGTGDYCKGYSLEQFEDAWADSDYFMITID